MKPTPASLSVSIVSLLGLLPLGAATVLIDFGTVAGRHSVGVADSNGNFWDYITGEGDNNTDLVDVNGSVTSIDLAVSGFTGPGSYNGGLSAVAGLGPGGDGSFAFDAVTDDALFLNSDGSTGTLTFGGLDDGSTYDLYFYGARVTTSSRFTTYAVGGSSVELQTSGSGIASNSTDNWNDDTVVGLTGISPSSGQIVVNVTANSASGGGGSDTFGYVNAMRITQVPEPSAALLGGLGVLGLLGRRRRQA